MEAGHLAQGALPLQVGGKRQHHVGPPGGGVPLAGDGHQEPHPVQAGLLGRRIGQGAQGVVLIGQVDPRGIAALLPQGGQRQGQGAQGRVQLGMAGAGAVQAGTAALGKPSARRRSPGRPRRSGVAARARPPFWPTAPNRR